jgi:hypothetical protein
MKAITRHCFANQYGLLGYIIAADMNSTADQQFNWAPKGINVVIDKIFANNASTSLTLSAGGIYTAAAKGGTAIVAAAQLYSGLTAANLSPALTVAAFTGAFLNLAAGPFLSLTTAQGAAATCDIWITGTVFDNS